MRSASCRRLFFTPFPVILPLDLHGPLEYAFFHGADSEHSCAKLARRLGHRLADSIRVIGISLVMR
jgi:hypothetical protein